MASWIIIKQKGLFKKKLNMEQVAKWIDLPYGATNENFILQPYQLGKITVFFDAERIGRGFDCEIENNNIVLHLPLPATAHDTDLFYQKAAELCRRLKIQEVYLDDDEEDELTASVDQFGELAKNDKEASEKVLGDMYSKVKDDPNLAFVVGGALNLISFDAKRSEAFIGNLDAFEEAMHSLQAMDIYFANCMYFRRNSDDSVAGLYALADGVLSAVPKKPGGSPLSDLKVEQFYVMLPGDNAVPYQTFIDNAKIIGEYDASCVTIRLDECQINEISGKGTVDPITGESVPCNPYHKE